MKDERIRIIVPVALKETMESLLPDFARATGCSPDITVMLNPEVPGYIASGGEWDVALSNPEYVEQILSAGHGEPGTHRPLARSPLAFGVGDRADGARELPADDLAGILLDAESIAVTETGTSGRMFRHLLAALDIEATVQPKLRPMAGGEPMAALIAGTVAMAALPLTNIAPIAGVRPAAICPTSLGVHIDLSLCVRRNAADAARALADWLTDPARDAAFGDLGAERFVLER